jgi:hypothetical protein
LDKTTRKITNKLELLSRKFRTKTKEWNGIAEFLRAQGIKADARNMPDFSKLLSTATEEKDTEEEKILKLLKLKLLSTSNFNQRR